MFMQFEVLLPRVALAVAMALTAGIGRLFGTAL